jgi:hypothetical protein
MVMKAQAKMETRTVAAGEFKAKCLQLMDEVQAGGLTLVVTKRGKPVVPVECGAVAGSEDPGGHSFAPGLG